MWSCNSYLRNNGANSLHSKPTGGNNKNGEQLLTCLPSELILEKDFGSDPNYPALKKVSGSLMALPDSPPFKASYWLLQHDLLKIVWNDVRFLPWYVVATRVFFLSRVSLCLAWMSLNRKRYLKLH
jgi:hypothetical protein